MLSTFKEQFDNSYQLIFQKVLVGKDIANTRFEADLTYGSQLKRVKYDITNVRVRDVTIGIDRVVDSITDSSELITINRNKGTTFAMSTREKKQAGPLNPAAEIGAKVAMKTAIYVDADILAETQNAFADFDNGDLSATTSSGVPITLNATTVPQMVSRMSAKLKANNQVLTNLVFVVDGYGQSDVIQYLLGKNINFAESVFKNGFAGPIMTADLYTSENLTGQALLTNSVSFSDGDTITINGIVFTMNTVLTATAGSVLIGANVAASLTNLASSINLGSGSGTTYTAVSAANQVKLVDALRLVATATTTTLGLVGTGSGRLAISKVSANTTITANYIHAYYGKKGAIDVVVQDKVDMEMRDEPKQRATNILSDILYGIKTFNDGAQQFLDVLIAA